MLTDEHTQKLANLNYLLTISQKPRDTGNPFNDMTGISGGKPLPKGTPAPKEMQLPLPGINWEKFKVQSTPNNQDMSIAGAPRYIKGNAPPNVIWKAPHIDSRVIDNWRDRGYTPGMEIPKPGGPQLPDFVQNPDGGEQLAQNYQPYDAAMDDLRLRRSEGSISDKQWIKELKIIKNTLYPKGA